MSSRLRFATAKMPDALVEMGRRLDKMEFDQCVRLSSSADLTLSDAAPALPSSVDYSACISYIRDQGAYGCGLNAAAAYWDIVFRKDCWPYFHPNMSVNHMLWGWEWSLQKPPSQIPGRRWGIQYPTLDDMLHMEGCPSEGTELTNSDAVQWPMLEGYYECGNYRLAKPAQNIKLDLNELRYWLSRGPVRVAVWDNHFVTLVGYDDNQARFKFVNSWGDRWSHPGAPDGFGYITYSNMVKEINGAEVYYLKAPRSIPCAKIHFHSQYRQDVHLWLVLENKPVVRRIWPNGQRQDVSWNLSLIVPLPRGFSWPPTPENRIFLNVYDSGEHSNVGGIIEEFTVGFCGQYHYSSDIAHGPKNNIVNPSPPGGLPGSAEWNSPVHFKPRELVRLKIP